MKQDHYMLVKEGELQYVQGHHEGQDMLLWIVTENIQDAKRLANQWNKKGVRPARIGSVEGETFDGLAALASEAGAVPTLVTGWKDDGTPELLSMTKQRAMMLLAPDGSPQYVSVGMGGETFKACPLVFSEADAMRLADRYGVKDVTIGELPPGKVNSTPEDSPYVALAIRAFDDGCRFIVRLERWDEHGEAVWKPIADANTFFDD